VGRPGDDDGEPEWLRIGGWLPPLRRAWGGATGGRTAPAGYRKARHAARRAPDTGIGYTTGIAPPTGIAVGAPEPPRRRRHAAVASAAGVAVATTIILTVALIASVPSSRPPTGTARGIPVQPARTTASNAAPPAEPAPSPEPSFIVPTEPPLEVTRPSPTVVAPAAPAPPPPGPGPTGVPAPAGTGVPPSGHVSIVNRNTGRCVEVNAFDTSDGAIVQQWSCNGGTNQQWAFAAWGNGYYLVVNRNSNKCLDLGDRILQWQCHGGTNQQWQLAPVTDGNYRLVNRATGRILGVVNCGTADPTGVAAYPRADDNCQQFRFR
jgi:hypothetical protein